MWTRTNTHTQPEPYTTYPVVCHSPVPHSPPMTGPFPSSTHCQEVYGSAPPDWGRMDVSWHPLQRSDCDLQTELGGRRVGGVVIPSTSRLSSPPQTLVLDLPVSPHPCPSALGWPRKVVSPATAWWGGQPHHCQVYHKDRGTCFKLSLGTLAPKTHPPTHQPHRGAWLKRASARYLG